MQDQPAPFQDGATPFTLREAAEVLGISLNTLRRRIAAGQVQAERVQRPQGHVWQIYLHGADTQEHRASSTVQQDGAGTVQQPPQALAQAEAMAAYTRSILEPLVVRMAEQEGTIREQAETIGRQSERVAELESRNGHLSAELIVERQAKSTLTASTAPQSVDPTNGGSTYTPLAAAGPLALAGAGAGRGGHHDGGAASMAEVRTEGCRPSRRWRS
jgi:hypothetical protein